MTAALFRRIALQLPRAIQSSHMGHPDFRIGKRVFATLGHPDTRFGVVKLTPDQQRMLVESEPEVFMPVSGGWGRRGSTHVLLAAADRRTLKSALVMAWKNVAPKRLIDDFEGGAE